MKISSNYLVNNMKEKVKKLKEIINNSNNIVVFTGAGISCPSPSNIPDFRSSNGIYSSKTNLNIPVEEIISRDFFLENTKDFYNFYFNKMVYPNALPNKAHKYFSKLEKLGKVKAVVTQNIDNLHQLAGSRNVIELHGSVHRNYCMKCRKFYSLDDILGSDVPKCSCGGIIKPDVVLYNEMLDYDNIEKAIHYISSADTLIVVGTSLTVYPARSYINYFKGKNLVLINKSKTDFDMYSSLVINEDVVKVIEMLE